MHTSEVPFYLERQKRGECLVTGMSFPVKGKVDLDVTETPHMADNLSGCRVEERHERVAPALQQTQRAVEADELTQTAGVEPAAPTILAHGTTSTSLPPALPAEPPTAAERVPLMVVCQDCGVEHEEGVECSICGPLVRMLAISRERRKAWHLYKKGEGPKPI